jgi:four helix bundle protein
MGTADCGLWNGVDERFGIMWEKGCRRFGIGQNKSMDNKDLKLRTKHFAIGIIRICEGLPKSRSAEVIGKQLLRSGTSVGSNYRAACRARSPADFIAKMGIVEEECDESIYWMELLIETELLQEQAVKDLLDEANQLLAITIASIKTTRKINNVDRLLKLHDQLSATSCWYSWSAISTSEFIIPQSTFRIHHSSLRIPHSPFPIQHSPFRLHPSKSPCSSPF